jgi:pyridoxine kinase
VTVDSIASLCTAIDTLHRLYSVPHIVITSVIIPSTTAAAAAENMFCAGSTITSSGASRKFIVDVPVIDGFYSGTGDLFAALTLARLREGSAAAGLLSRKGWVPDDAVAPLELPLTKAVEKVLGSMHCVLEETREARDVELAGIAGKDHRAVTKASELRLVRRQKELLQPVVVRSARILE